MSINRIVGREIVIVTWWNTTQQQKRIYYGYMYDMDKAYIYCASEISQAHKVDFYAISCI